ncbi:MAG: alpha/beta fold hydrolase [Rhodothermales bacterium]|nr:alpha/beta fold hydrolase [Rhodothermales bacterium]
MTNTDYTIHTTQGFRYADEGPSHGKGPVVLLHGMMGEVGNWEHTIGSLSRAGFRVLVPILPVYALPMKQTHLPGLVSFVRSFMDALGLSSAVVSGNSLGGHIALMLAINHPERVRALVLTGASGIYEVDMGQGVMRRKDREFLRERAAITFYDPKHATKELVDEVYETVNNRMRAVRLIKMARSVKEENVRDDLGTIEVPTLLIWGREDEITPPDVAVTFNELISRSELHWIDECGHAPMLEKPDEFNEILLDFLGRVTAYEAVA